MKSMFKRMTMGDPNVLDHVGYEEVTEEDREIVRKANEDEARSLARIKQEIATKHQKSADKATSQ